MKSVIKTTIGILAISLASVSVSQADSNRHNRDYDRAPGKHYSRDSGRRDHKKYSHQQYRGKHVLGHNKHPRSKHAGWKRHYWEHNRMKKRHQRAHRRAVKQMHRERAYRRALRHDYRQRIFLRNYGHVRYVAPVPRVTYRSHSHHNNVVPVIAGGIIGSSIANNVSHGDPAATLGGAIFGAVIGDAMARH